MYLVRLAGIVVPPVVGVCYYLRCKSRALQGAAEQPKMLRRQEPRLIMPARYEAANSNEPRSPQKKVAGNIHRAAVVEKRPPSMNTIFVQIKCDIGTISMVYRNILAIANSCVWSTPGEYDLIVKITVRDKLTIGQTIEQLQILPHVRETFTIIAFKLDDHEPPTGAVAAGSAPGCPARSQAARSGGGELGS